jgi:exonuclease VII small subunit
LKARDETVARQSAHIAHLDALCSYRERLVEQRDTELAESRGAIAAAQQSAADHAAALDSARQAIAALEAERARLERAITAQEHIINYRQSARWWLQLPWLRVRNLWQRVSAP